MNYSGCILIDNLIYNTEHVNKSKRKQKMKAKLQLVLNKKPLRMVRPDCKAYSKTYMQRLTKMMKSDRQKDRPPSISWNCFAILPKKNFCKKYHIINYNKFHRRVVKVNSFKLLQFKCNLEILAANRNYQNELKITTDPKQLLYKHVYF